MELFDLLIFAPPSGAPIIYIKTQKKKSKKKKEIDKSDEAVFKVYIIQYVFKLLFYVNDLLFTIISDNFMASIYMYFILGFEF